MGRKNYDNMTPPPRQHILEREAGFSSCGGKGRTVTEQLASPAVPDVAKETQHSCSN